MITTMISINLFYQFWVHHGSNVRYLDCNHGGVLIIWGGNPWSTGLRATSSEGPLPRLRQAGDKIDRTARAL